MVRNDKKNAIPKIDDDLLKRAEGIVEKKKVQAKQIKATKDSLIGRAKKTHPIPVVTGEEEDGTPIETIFQARRLTPRERANMKLLNVDTENLASLSEEELNDIEDQGYELLSTVIIEPKLTADEWKDVDIALTQDLTNKAMALQSLANDAAAVEFFQDLNYGDR